MAAITGILNNQSTASQAVAGNHAKPMASSSTGSSSSSTSTSAASISANDFLTLLVTELKNQDPTANADPNAYVNQLVSVNSLEQLVSINQTLTKDAASNTGSNGTTTNVSGARAAAASLNNAAASANPQAASSTPASGSSVFGAAAAKVAPGNLGLPNANPAAHTVANALSGQHIPTPH